MNKRILNLLFFVLLLSNLGVSQPTDTVACNRVEKELSVIRSFIKSSSGSLSETVQAIKFLTKLTGIEYSSDFNYAGAMCPTKKDYDRWHEWYIKNKTRLAWNDQRKEVFVKKE